VAYTHNDLENMVFENLSALASDAGFTAAFSFENSVIYALITVVGSDDATLVTESNLISVISWAEFWGLKKLYNYYLTAVDFVLGPRQEKLSQIARGLKDLMNSLGLSSSQAPIVFKEMTWTFNDFTVSGISSWPINWYEVDWDNRW
jgi:hypothetical protein